MAYGLSNKYTEKFCKRIFLVQLIVEDVVTCFLEHCRSTIAGRDRGNVLRHE